MLQISNGRRWGVILSGFLFLFLFLNRPLWRAASGSVVSFPDIFRLNLVPLVVILMHLVVFLGLGRFLLERFDGLRGAAFDKKLVFSFTLGTLAWGYLVFALGLIGLMRLEILGPLFLAALIACLWRWGRSGWSSARDWLRSELRDTQGWELTLMAGLILWGLGNSFLQSLVPITGVQDAVSYHMVIPKAWAKTGSLHYIPWLVNANWPQHNYMLYILPILAKVDAAANGVHAFFGLFSVLAILAFGRDWVSRRARYFGAAVFATLPVVTQNMGYARNDLGWSFYVFLAGLCLVRPDAADDSDRNSTLMFAGISAGLAAACRFQGLGACAFLAAVCFAFPSWSGRSRKEIIFFGIALALVGAPWYLRNAWVNGNPFLPFFYNLLGGKNWTDLNQYLFEFESRRYASFWERASHPYPGVKSMLLHLYSPVIAGFASQYFFLPLGALALLRRFSMPRLFRVFAAAYFVHYLLIMKIPETWWRFSIPFAACGALLLGYLKEQPISLLKGTIRLPAVAAGLIAAIALTPAFFIRFKIIPTTLLGLRSADNPSQGAREKFLRETAFYYPVCARVNQETPKNAKILLYRQAYGYYIDRDILWGSPADQGLIRYGELATAEDLYRRLKEIGITHILVWEKYIGTDVGYSDIYTSYSDPKMLEMLQKHGQTVFEMDQHRLWSLS